MRSTSLAVAALAALTLAAPSALAQESAEDERARLHFEAGRSYYEEGNYEEALDEFRRAYTLSNRPVLLMNIAHCQERLGQWAEAAESLEQFIATMPPNAEERPTLQRRIENLRARAAQHGTTEPDATSTPAPTTSATGASDGLLVPSLVAFGVGGAGLIAWGILGGLALGEESTIAAGCGATRSCTPAEVQAMDDLALGSDISLGIGLAGILAGVILIVVDPPRGATTEAASIQVLPTGDRYGAGLTVRGAF